MSTTTITTRSTMTGLTRSAREAVQAANTLPISATLSEDQRGIVSKILSTLGGMEGTVSAAVYAVLVVLFTADPEATPTQGSAQARSKAKAAATVARRYLTSTKAERLTDDEALSVREAGQAAGTKALDNIPVTTVVDLVQSQAGRDEWREAAAKWKPQAETTAGPGEPSDADSEPGTAVVAEADADPDPINGPEAVALLANVVGLIADGLEAGTISKTAQRGLRKHAETLMAALTAEAQPVS